MDDDELVERLLAGERRPLARLLTYVEDGSVERVRNLVGRLHPHTARAHLLGVTGSPGVGKSTVVNALIAEWRNRGRRVAVVAVDPTSPFSGGALLGDRVRMQDHALDEGVFVRSMASRGHLGGLSWTTPHALVALDAAGFDMVVVETVGVGQAEVEVASTADTTVVAVAPGMGDAIQAAKAGILEVADVFCVNKADREGTQRTIRELKEMQHLAGEAAQWQAPICPTVAAEGRGIGELADAIDQHREWLGDSGTLARRRHERAARQISDIAMATLRARIAAFGDGQLVGELATRVAERQLDPYTAADQLVAGLQG